jgi:excisionase family DNA binding protein
MGTKDDITLDQIGRVGEPMHGEPSGHSGAAERHPRRLAVSVTEAAGMLGISRTLAYELIHRGELPVIQLGRRLVVPIVALEALVNGDGRMSSHASTAISEVR